MSALTVLDNASEESRSRNTSRAEKAAIKAFPQNNEIPRCRGPIPPAPMLASTVIARRIRPKKKNLVSAPLNSKTISEPSLVECCARPSRAATWDRDSQRAVAATCHPRAGANDAESRSRPGVHRPGPSASSSGSSSGARLSRIPPCPAFEQLTLPLGGSTGVPDSLDTKQASTSGPGAVSRGLVITPAVLTSARPSSHAPPKPFFYSLKRTVFFYGCNPRRRTLFRPAQSIPVNAFRSRRNIAKNFPKMTPENYCTPARDRVTFVVYRANGKHTEPPPPAANYPPGNRTISN